MKQYDVYGIGNALVDTEYKVDDGFISHLVVNDRFPKVVIHRSQRVTYFSRYSRSSSTALIS